MIQLLIIADDFTGALDTGVQFAGRGIRTRVFTGPERSLSGPDPDVSVAVVDAETRHLDARQAYDTVYRLTRQAAALGIRRILKKTDSALRGNIGAELSAVLEASGEEQLWFLPAFPRMNRLTLGGIHYIDGRSVAESVFGRDPFEPVRRSSVREIISEQSRMPVTLSPPIRPGDAIPAGKGIVVFDAAGEEQLCQTARALRQADRLTVMAGCAGLGAVLPELLELPTGGGQAFPRLDRRLTVLCGSVNPITLRQMDEAEARGFARLRLLPAQKLTEGYFWTEAGKALLDRIRRTLAAHDAVIIDSNDAGGNALTEMYAKAHGLTAAEQRVRISGALGAVLGGLFDCPDLGTLLITGGDTLMECMNAVGVSELEPIGEMAPGVVLSRFSAGGRERCVISKSGGFGGPGLLAELKRQIGEA